MHHRVAGGDDCIPAPEVAGLIGILIVMLAAVHLDDEPFPWVREVDLRHERLAIKDHELTLGWGQPLLPDLLYRAGLKSTRRGPGTGGPQCEHRAQHTGASGAAPTGSVQDLLKSCDRREPAP